MLFCMILSLFLLYSFSKVCCFEDEIYTYKFEEMILFFYFVRSHFHLHFIPLLCVYVDGVHSSKKDQNCFFFIFLIYFFIILSTFLLLLLLLLLFSFFFLFVFWLAWRQTPLFKEFSMLWRHCIMCIV